MNSSTRILFPARRTEATVTVLHVQRMPPAPTDPEASAPRGAQEPRPWLVITDRTPFHPLDHAWPDQPGDTGQLLASADTLPVLDCLTAARADGGPVHVDTAIPVRRGAEGHCWYAAHVLDAALDEGRAHALVGTQVELRVNARRRRALSAAHSACHLVGIALNAALRDRWRKPVDTDGLGRPNFDSLAISSSRLTEFGSTDIHRLGSSLRRRGFVADGLAERLPAIREQVAATLAGWLALDAPISLYAHGDRLEDRRSWECTLPEGTHRTWCGGTHPERTGEVAVDAVALSLAEDGRSLTVTTSTRPRNAKP
ncbi:metal-dependent hydrolase [Streptomyces sp. NPDC051976]|uniref:metal-dependent hydrolase n=1 Tax=Streptomyces sp. NPDC051976 TaxID=3154947 RepID=UPI0034329E42